MVFDATIGFEYVEVKIQALRGSNIYVFNFHGWPLTATTPWFPYLQE